MFKMVKSDQQRKRELILDVYQKFKGWLEKFPGGLVGRKIFSTYKYVSNRNTFLIVVAVFCFTIR